MKKLISLALILLLTLSLVACGEPESTDTLSIGEPALSDTGNSSTDEEFVRVTTTQGTLIDPTVDYTEFPGEVVTLPEPPGGYDTLTVLKHAIGHPTGGSLINKKMLSDGWTQNLIETLLNAPETGASVEKLSDNETLADSYINKYGARLPIKEQTRWFIVEDTIFRYVGYPDYKLYQVKNLLGAGKEIELSEELKTMLELAISYAPTNCYTGTWSKDKFELKHTFSAEHNVDISVDKITHTPNPKDGGKYTVHLTLQAQKNLTVSIDYSANFSIDNLGAHGETTVSLEAGKAKTIDIEFSQYKRHPPFTLDMRIFAGGLDSTIEILVQPPRES